MSPTGSESGRRSGEVGLQPGAWNRAAGHGVVFDSSAGFRLGEGSCLSPDASWVPRERWLSLPPEEREGFAPLCPDAVFEVRSRTDALAELREKMRLYLGGGARLAVLIDPEERAVEVYRPDRRVQRHGRAAAVSLDPELSGFSLDLRAVFDL